MSYIEMDCTSLRLICWYAIRVVRKYRVDEAKKFAAEKMKWSNFWRRLFFMKPITLRQAIYNIRHDGSSFGDGFTLYCICNRCDERYRKAWAFLRACEWTQGGTVKVGVGDLAVLQGHYYE